jgi:hypothetical protein
MKIKWSAICVGGFFYALLLGWILIAHQINAVIIIPIMLLCIMAGVKFANYEKQKTTTKIGDIFNEN